MKKVLSLFLSVVMLLPITAGLDFSIYADELTTGQCGENAYYSFDFETGILTISGIGEIYNYREETNDSPFSFHSEIEYLIIENGITVIGDIAFRNCSNLISVIIPNSVTSINNWAFAECSNLTSITIPDGVTSIGHCVFYKCTSLKNVTIPNSVVSIGANAFYNVAPDNMVVENKMHIIGDCIVSVDSTIEGDIIIPENVRLIAEDAFEGCSRITGVTIPNRVTNLDVEVFSNCSRLTNIIIPNSVTNIGVGAFANCVRLTSIIIPNSVTNIGYNAFYKCTKLTDVYYKGTENQWNKIEFYNFNYCLLNATIHYIDCIHEYDNGVILEKATCTKSGLIKYTCVLCGNTKTTDIPAEHNYDNGIVVKNATCTEYGQLKYTCTLCGDSQTFTTSTLQPLGHSYGEYISNNDATYDKDGTKTAICTRCGAENTIIDEGSKLVKEPDLTDFIIKTVSLSLESSITMNFKVLKSAVDGFENPYMVFKCGNDELIVADYTEQGDYYVFSYQGISPQLMNDDVTAVLRASYNGRDYASPKKAMSVRTYAYTMLERYHTDDYAKLRTLLVDLLNYGAASQKYVGYHTNNLVNADLTDEQKSWGTSTVPTFENIRDYNYKTIDNPTSEWVGSGLVLNNSVTVRAKFTADSIENKTVVITCGKGIFTYSADDFVQDKDGNYYVYCNEIFANEMSEEILLTVYNNGIPCSNTMRFSIESYAKLVHDSCAGTALDELTTAMMRYGNSAEALGA